MSNEVWVLCRLTEHSSGWNQTHKAFELNQEGSWREGPTSPAFATEQDALNYIDKLIASENRFYVGNLRPLRLTFFEADCAHLAEPFIEAEQESYDFSSINRKELLGQLLPELNRLFGMEYAALGKDNSCKGDEI